MLSILYLVLESLAVILPILLAVAWMTILERKVLAATQRRVGPNSVGYYGILQPFNLLFLIYLFVLFFLFKMLYSLFYDWNNLTFSLFNFISNLVSFSKQIYYYIAPDTSELINPFTSLLVLTKFNEKQINSLYSHFLKKNSWKKINRFKKHKAIDSFNCSGSVPISIFISKWWDHSGIYKITLLPFRLFTYYGSSKNLGQRIKYHYTNGKYHDNHLGLAFSFFGLQFFSFTIVELCSTDDLKTREDWYLNTFNPLLNMLTESYMSVNSGNSSSILRNQKISDAIKARGPLSKETKSKMSASKTGNKNFWFNKTLPKKVLDAAAELKGTKVFAYDEKSFELINNKPFRSIRDTAKFMPISANTLASKLDSGKPFKGFYYFSSSHKF